jgi:hypothetical protein
MMEVARMTMMMEVARMTMMMEVTIIRMITIYYSLIIYYLDKKDDKAYNILWLAEESNINKEIN